MEKRIFNYFSALSHHMIKLTVNELRILRQLRGMKQKEVAQKMKISSQRYSILENSEHLSYERTIEILAALDFTEEAARVLLNSVSNQNLPKSK